MADHNTLPLVFMFLRQHFLSLLLLSL